VSKVKAAHVEHLPPISLQAIDGRHAASDSRKPASEAGRCGLHVKVARFKRVGPPGYVGRPELCATSWCGVSGPLDFGDGPCRFHLPGDIDERPAFLEDDQDVPDNEYEGIACPACTKLHFVNRKTGKLLGHDEL